MTALKRLTPWPKPQAFPRKQRSRRDSGPEPGGYPSKLGARFPDALSTQASTVGQKGGAFVAAFPSSLAQDALRAAGR